MRPARTYRPFTPEENKQIETLLDEGKTAKQIAEIVGRTAGAVSRQIFRMRKATEEGKPNEEKPKQIGLLHADAPTVKVIELTPRQMIKKLYDLGYRIENNQLVCYTKNVVKIQDIIHGEG